MSRESGPSRGKSDRNAQGPSYLLWLLALLVLVLVSAALIAKNIYTEISDHALQSI